jgi:hypothetical protein
VKKGPPGPFFRVHTVVMAEACELCDAARMTQWYHEDELCWIAECESCSVPMVVWRSHDPSPPVEVREELIRRLRHVAEPLMGGELWIDDHLRSIPDHYHAHARRRFRLDR